MSSLKVVPTVVEFFEAACSRQLSNLGGYIKLADKDFQRLLSIDGLVTASIAAESEDLSIQIYLSLPAVFLRETMPLIEVDNESIVRYQEDWCMELANRFLGDLKNQLLSQNCVMRMGLPKLLEVDLRSLEPHDGYEDFERLFLVDSHLLAMVHDLPLAFKIYIKQINSDFEFVEDDDFEDDDCFEMGELEHL